MDFSPEDFFWGHWEIVEQGDSNEGGEEGFWTSSAVWSPWVIFYLRFLTRQATEVTANGEAYDGLAAAVTAVSFYEDALFPYL